MAEQKNLEQAKIAFATLCKTLEENDWVYKKDDEKLIIECSARGDDLPMEITVKVDADRMLVLLLSHLPFVIQDDKRIEIAIAVSAINNALVDGSFDYDLMSGHLFFRMTNSFLESQLSEQVFAYMLYCSCHTIDNYNDKLLMLAKGMISVEQFISTLGN